MRNASEFTVHFVKDGVTQSFPPGAEFPEWAEPLITNPLVIGVAETPKGEPVSSEGPPPHAGKGSSAKVWLEYAHGHGVEVPDDASRDDIIDACEKADIEV